MAVRIACECGEKIVESASELTELGLLDKRLYCETCRVPAEEYLRKRDELHTEIQAKWKNDLEVARAIYSARLNGGKLPE